MPELVAQETCPRALASVQSPFESTGSPFEYHGSPAANGSIIDSTYYPSAFLQAGAVLAVHLAARNLAGQDPGQDLHGNVPDQIVDPAIAAAGAGPGVGPDASGSPGSVDLSLTGLDDGNILPCRSDCSAPSLANFQFTGNLTETYQTEAFAEAATASDSDHFGHGDSSAIPSPPPRKRRRFEDKLEERQHLDHHGLTNITQEPVEMGRLSLSPEFGAPAQVHVDAMFEQVRQLVRKVLQEPASATTIPTILPTALPNPRPLGLVPERTPFSFFHFPGEIRNPIYSYSLHWPTTQELYRAYYSQLDEHYRYEDLHPNEPKRRPPTYKPKFRTPTILLLCRRITMECLGILQHRTLVIDGMPPWQTGDLRPLPITSFIPKTTFQAIRRLEIRIPMGLGSFGSGWVWSDIACDLFDMLRENNSFEHLRVVFVIRYSPGNGAWRTSEQHHLELIDHSLVRLERENPNLKWPCKLEREYWIVEGRRASKAHTNSKGELHPSNEELRTYPDDEIWPGCLLDFV